MQNIHAHAWNEKTHFSPGTIKEAEISRGCRLDLSVDFDSFMKDMVPFEKVAVFGLKAKLTGYWVPDEYIADFVKKAPGKLVGFASCDPSQKNCMEELRHAVEKLKLSGVKMGPIYTGVDPRDRKCETIYRYCEKNSLPLIFHTGTTFNSLAPLGLGHPLLFDEVAAKHLGLKIVLAHMGNPWCGECLAVIRKHPNMYADISALCYRPWQFYNSMLLAQEYKVTHKLLFGTDYPFAKSAESVEGLRNINKITGNSGLPKTSAGVIEDILGRDSFKLLGVQK